MRWKVVALAFAGFLAGMQSALAENIAVKAATPVQVSITPETPVTAGSVSSFVVRASSQLPSDNFVVTVLPPAGSSWVSGSQKWQGSIVPGQVQEFRFTLQLPVDAAPTISVTASIQAPDNTQLAASASYRSQSISLLGAKKVDVSRKVSRKGRAVVEYQLR